MTSPISAAPDGQPPQKVWPAMDYIVPPIAASAAIVPVFRDMMIKSSQQKGMPIPNVTVMAGLKEGLKAAPTVGAIVGTQMVLQKGIEKALSTDENETSLSKALASSAIVGTASAPVLAVFNGQTMGWGVRESLRKFTPKQAAAIAMQETGFVGGLSASDRVAGVMKEQFGDNKAVEYAAAFGSGAAGSLVGHPANTALTRWQSGLTIDKPSQLMWGAARKARAVGAFSMLYKAGKEWLNSGRKNE